MAVNMDMKDVYAFFSEKRKSSRNIGAQNFAKAKNKESGTAMDKGNLPARVRQLREQEKDILERCTTETITGARLQVINKGNLPARVAKLREQEKSILEGCITETIDGGPARIIPNTGARSHPNGNSSSTSPDFPTFSEVPSRVSSRSSLRSIGTSALDPSESHTPSSPSLEQGFFDPIPSSERIDTANVERYRLPALMTGDWLEEKYQTFPSIYVASQEEASNEIPNQNPLNGLRIPQDLRSTPRPLSDWPSDVSTWDQSMQDYEATWNSWNNPLSLEDIDHSKCYHTARRTHYGYGSCIRGRNYEVLDGGRQETHSRETHFWGTELVYDQGVPDGFSVRERYLGSTGNEHREFDDRPTGEDALKMYLGNLYYQNPIPRHDDQGNNLPWDESLLGNLYYQNPIPRHDDEGNGGTWDQPSSNNDDAESFVTNPFE